jgi:hypothetical protein
LKIVRPKNCFSGNTRSMRALLHELTTSQLLAT